MTAVTYHGEFPLEQVNDKGEPYIEQHGYTFVAGKSVDVKEKELAGKFAQNRFFKVAGQSDKDAVAQGEEDAEKAEVETLRGWLNDRHVPFHHKAGLKTLRDLKADYEAKQAKASEA